MKNATTAAEIHKLFANSDADEVWAKAVEIVRRINPEYDFFFAQTTFNDIGRLFRGEYPGYGPVKTLYHDLPHTLDVFLCAVRLMHGVNLSGTSLADNEMTIVMIAALMHDIGYAQRYGEENGTGAQHTQDHVQRGIEFVRRYIVDQGFPGDLAIPMESIIFCTDPAVAISEISFPDERSRLLGQIVATADLIGQMSDRAYLEKLPLLYLEFQEARLSSYKSMHDLLSKTQKFHRMIQERLDGQFGGLYTKLSLHFKDLFGVENNYYLESIEKNITYLSKVTSLNEDEWLPMLRRGGIAQKVSGMTSQKDPK